MKVILTAGEDAAGEVHLLYLGKDAEVAIKHLENPPPGIIKTALFKKPNWDKRRHFPANVLPETPAEPSTLETPVVVPPANDLPESGSELEQGSLDDEAGEPAQTDLPPADAPVSAPAEETPAETSTTAILEAAEEKPAKAAKAAKAAKGGKKS
jgi:hypothetical protein